MQVRSLSGKHIQTWGVCARIIFSQLAIGCGDLQPAGDIEPSSLSASRRQTPAGAHTTEFPALLTETPAHLFL